MAADRKLMGVMDTSTLRPVILETSDPTWSAFLRGKDFSLFATPRWARVIERTYGFRTGVLAVTGESGIAAGLPFAQIDDFRGSRFVVFPFSDNCEPVPESAWTLLEPVLAARTEPWSVRGRCLPTELALTSKEAAQHHYIDVPAENSEIAGLYHFKHVQNLKQALKAGLSARVVEPERAVEVYYELHSQVRKMKHGLLPQPRAFFEAIAQEYFPDNGFVLVAELDGRVVSAMFFLIEGDTLYYKFSASALDALSLRPNHFLISKAIELAVERKYARLDLGISDTEGLIRFKHRIGGIASNVYAATYGRALTKAEGVKEVERSLGALTQLLTGADLPLSAAQQGGDILYRFFT